MPTPDELRRARLQRRQQPQGDPQWGAGGAATIADSASFGFGPEVLHFMTGVPEDEVRRDIDAFGEARPIASGAIEWGPVVAGLGGLVKGAGKAVFRSARRGLAGALPERNAVGQVIEQVGKPSPVSGLPPAEAKGAVRQELMDTLREGPPHLDGNSRRLLYGAAAAPYAWMGGYELGQGVFPEQSEMSRKRPRR